MYSQLYFSLECVGNTVYSFSSIFLGSANDKYLFTKYLFNTENLYKREIEETETICKTRRNIFSKHKKKKLKDARQKPPKCASSWWDYLIGTGTQRKLKLHNWVCYTVENVQVLPQCCHLFSLCFTGVITGTEGRLGNHFVINSQQFPLES